jgi:hypothetical protein
LALVLSQPFQYTAFAIKNSSFSLTAYKFE